MESRFFEPPREMKIGFKTQLQKSGVNLQCWTEGRELTSRSSYREVWRNRDSTLYTACEQARLWVTRARVEEQSDPAGRSVMKMEPTRKILYIRWCFLSMVWFLVTYPRVRVRLLPISRLYELDVLEIRCLTGLVYPFAQFQCHINVL